MTASPARRRDAEENRAALLDAAGRLLARDADTSLEAIAAEAGLSRRSVYGHFATRDDLVGAAIDRGARRLSSLADDLPSADPAVALATLGGRLWDAVEQVRVAASFALRGPHVARVAEALGPMRRRLVAIIESGASDGSLRSDIPAGTLAHLVEQAAIAVLAEAATTGMDRAEGRRLVMLVGLGVAGLSAAEAATLIDATPSLRTPSTTEAPA